MKGIEMKSLFLAVFFTIIMVSSVNAQSTLALQEKCANAAKEYYESRSKNPDCRPIYESHYNKKLDKCFILIETFCTPFSNSMELIGVFERKVYGHFILGRNGCSKAWVDCEGFGMGKLCDDGKKCKTWREFEALIKPCMEE